MSDERREEQKLPGIQTLAGAREPQQYSTQPQGQSARYYGQPYAHPADSHSHIAAQSSHQSRAYFRPPATGYEQRPYPPYASQPHSRHYAEPASHGLDHRVSRDPRYEGSQSLPVSAGYYRQQYPQHSPDHPMATSPRDRPMDPARSMDSTARHMDSTARHMDSTAMRMQHYAQPQTHPYRAHGQYGQPQMSYPPYYRGVQEHPAYMQHPNAKNKEAEYRQGVSPPSYAGYSAASTPQSAGFREDVYMTDRHKGPVGTQPPAPQQAGRPPARPVASPQLHSPTHSTNAGSTVSLGKMDGDNQEEVDEAVLKRRKRNAQSAARLRERRKTRENELNKSCDQLETQITRLEKELAEEKRRATLEFKKEGIRLREARESDEASDSACVGSKRQRSTADAAMEDAEPKRTRPLRELDQVRLSELKAKIATVGKLNQNICVSLGMLRKEIERLADNIARKANQRC
ncbi:hypothetical protein H4R22_002632 [Coemansia sp. RSA 1290]|nr:hypothetical protein H4R22_002632 [Coemansia sp. RSA 1290]KAJ2651088.1 hypothetical protein IWW40_001856 [Coemansia sp. RSA 1250]